MTSSQKRATMNMLVRQWRDSGLSQARFAAKNNLTLVKFRYWVKKLKEPSDNEAGFIQLNDFLPQTISLRYPNGVELLLPSQTPVHILKDLIRFEARCSR